MNAVTYITPEALVTLLRNPTSNIIVVDVRNDDRAGGHIRNSVHIPAQQFKNSTSHYYHAWRDKDAIIFHCMVSQMRGPSCAMAMARTADQEQGQDGGEKGPKIQVLQGGFSAFAMLFSKENEDLFEDFDTKLHGDGWERD